MSDRRPWLALVVGLFCLPLFVGLGNGDLVDDEAIYSFAVDRILETGDWLEPKSIPNEDWAFLEKPPLKFWIVAAPIQLGLLPHDEFGLRFWDALFGGLGLVYVFLIGARLAGPICGTVAVLVLFAHWSLLFTHGLRSNNMEASLFLAYCGGIFHFMRWAAIRPGSPVSGTGRETAGSGRTHACAFGLYFVLGFMTKLVAVLFLPLVVGVAAALVPSCRRHILRAWRLWVGVAGLALALIAPWFVWASREYGWTLWQTMLSVHVYDRFTTYLDPVHVQPWHYYVTTMYVRFAETGVASLVAGGLVLLAVQTMRRRWLDGLVVLLWAILPTALVSAGTSKLYHYAYPFLPPLALAVGYLATLLVLLAPVPFGRLMMAWHEYLTRRLPAVSVRLRRPAVRLSLLTIAAIAIGLAIVTLVVGPVHFNVSGQEVFRNSGVFRPVVIALVFGTLGGAIRGSSRVLVAVLVASLLPLPAYRRSLAALTVDAHPIRAARDCLIDVQADVPSLRPGLYVDVPSPAISHPLYYYLRRVRPWDRSAESSPGQFDRHLAPPSLRPVLVWEPTYQEWRRSAEGASSTRGRSPDMVVFQDTLNHVLLLLPGPYSRCSAVAAAAPFD